jgi:hypothetical protein
VCFSPEMDAVAGTVVTLIGIDALRQVRNPRHLPLAALPLLFGVHQLIETAVWLNLQGHLSDAWGRPATIVYALIALALVPFMVPFAFLRADLVKWRSVALGCLALGTVAGGLGLWGVARTPVTACINGHHIDYSGHIPAGTFQFCLYIVATMLPALIGRSALLRLFGVLNVLAVAGLIWLQRDAVTSLWCVWAAITSVLIDLWVRRQRTTVWFDQALRKREFSRAATR